ncbi:MAG: hypothetical protein AVDCRST_MAG23-1696, partial [uncultured Sphingosinicella sp.]
VRSHSLRSSRLGAPACDAGSRPDRDNDGRSAHRRPQPRLRSRTSTAPAPHFRGRRTNLRGCPPFAGHACRSHIVPERSAGRRRPKDRSIEGAGWHGGAGRQRRSL